MGTEKLGKKLSFTGTIKQTIKKFLEANKKRAKEESAFRQILIKKARQTRRKAEEQETLVQIKSRTKAKVKARFQKKQGGGMVAFGSKIPKDKDLIPKIDY